MLKASACCSMLQLQLERTQVEESNYSDSWSHKHALCQCAMWYVLCCVMHFEKSEQGWTCAMTDMFRVDLSGRQVLTVLSLGLAHGFGNTSQGIVVQRECTKRCEFVARVIGHLSRPIHEVSWPATAECMT